MNSPWRTLDRLQLAQSVLKPGDSVYFFGGNYFVTDTSKINSYLGAKGTALNRITYRNYGSEKPIIIYDRRTIYKNASIQRLIGPADYTVFEGLTFRQTEESRAIAFAFPLGATPDEKKAWYFAHNVRAMSIWGKNVIIRNCIFDNFSSVGVSTMGSNVTIEHSEFKNIANHSLYIEGANGIFRHNILDGSKQIKASIYGIQLQYGGTDQNKIYGNLIKNTWAAGIMFSGPVANNVIFNNVFINSGHYVVSFFCYTGSLGLGNKFFHNTAIGPNKNAPVDTVIGTTSNCQNSNGGKPLAELVSITNNIFYPSNVPPQSMNSVTTMKSNIFFNISGKLPGGNILANPGLANPKGTTAASAMLTSGSPAIDEASSTDLLFDFKMSSRPGGTQNDIGAFEFIPGLPNPPPVVRISEGD